MPEAYAPPTRNQSFLPLLLLVILIVPAAALRVLATHNGVWLDEIISLQIAKEVKSPWQVFSGVHNENNHYLNTLYLYLVGQQSYAPVYRRLSVVFGIGLVAAGYWLLARRSRGEAVILAGLLACSYPLIHFSSEARGYSGALLGSVVACAALVRCMEQSSRWRLLCMGLAYGLALVLAILSNLTACLIWLPLAAGSLLIFMGRPGRVKSALLWIAINVLPASVLTALYFLDLRHLPPLGGGPRMTLAHGLGRLLSLALGWPARDALTVWIVLIPLIALTVWQLAAIRKAGDPSWILLALIYLMPLACILFIKLAFFSPRYFLVVVPFVYVPLAMLLARLADARAGRALLAVVLALFVVGQARLYLSFLRVGRGQISAALRYMITDTPSPELRVASNQDFRALMELNYYAPRVLGDRQLAYVTLQNQVRFPADWYIFHGEGHDPPGPAVFYAQNQPAWYRVAYFGSSELSGQALTIYSHQPPQ